MSVWARMLMRLSGRARVCSGVRAGVRVGVRADMRARVLAGAYYACIIFHQIKNYDITT